MLVDGDHLGVLVAEAKLQRAVLNRLKPRGMTEQIAKCRVIRGRHGRKHVPHRRQLRLNEGNAREHLERRIEVVAAHALEHTVEFVQKKPQPQLRGLMHDDEHHLVVLIGQRLLRIQQLRKLQIVAVGQRFTEIPVNGLIGEVDLLALLVGRVAHGSDEIGAQLSPNTQEGTRRQPSSSSASRRACSGQ